MAKAKKKVSSIKKTKVKAPAKKKVQVKAQKKTTLKKASKVSSKSSKAKKAVVKKAAAKKTTAKKTTELKSFQNNLTPLDDRLLVSVKGVERKTAGGLIIPDTVADQSGNLQGLVRASGRGHLSKKGRLRAMDVHIGDQVLFSEYSGTKVELDGEEYLILRESDVLGILQK